MTWIAFSVAVTLAALAVVLGWPGWLYRVFLIWGLGLCPRCRELLAWGQWNDGAWAGRPFCLNRNCPHPRPKSPARTPGNTSAPLGPAADAADPPAGQTPKANPEPLATSGGRTVPPGNSS